MSTPTSAPPQPPKAGSWFSRNVIALGLVSLFTDISSEMIMPLLPAFLTLTLGAGASALGWVEGLADAVASFLKLVSGKWADKRGKDRPFVLAGYTISSVIRPLVALATAPWHVVAVRVCDRVGKGIRTSPRDALLAKSVVPEQRGRAYGFHRSMDNLGAVLGPIFAVLILTYLSEDLRTVFWLAAIPGIFAVLVIAFGVREAPAPEPKQTATSSTPLPSEERRHLLRFLIPLAVFTIGDASDTFLLLKAGATHAPLVALPLLWMGFHFVKVVVAMGSGKLADRWGFRPLIAWGWLAAILIFTALAFAESQWVVGVLFLVYGTYHGLSEGPSRALVASIASTEHRGTAFGWYHFTMGCAVLPASVMFGLLWDAFGSQTAFLVSAGFQLAGLVLLMVLVGNPKEGSRQRGRKYQNFPLRRMLNISQTPRKPAIEKPTNPMMG